MSVDAPLGLPFNMLQCYFLLDAMAKVTGHKTGKVFHKMVNVHIYEDQLDLFEEQLNRKPLTKSDGFDPKFELPEDLTYEKLLTTFTPSDCTLTGYKHLGRIDYPFSE
jgi:thymidylate synthase